MIGSSNVLSELRIFVCEVTFLVCKTITRFIFANLILWIVNNNKRLYFYIISSAIEYKLYVTIWWSNDGFSYTYGVTSVTVVWVLSPSSEIRMESYTVDYNLNTIYLNLLVGFIFLWFLYSTAAIEPGTQRLKKRFLSFLIFKMKIVNNFVKLFYYDISLVFFFSFD